MVLFPNAKINVGLHVGSKREDGYHDLWTVFWPIQWCDILEITPAKGEETTLTVTGRAMDCCMTDNLVFKAWLTLHERFQVPNVDINLHKIIPDKAGLGGGSSDAAFMLKGLNDMFNLGLSKPELVGIAAELGADCPFFIYNEPLAATGKGEIFSPLPSEPLPFPASDCRIAIVKPNVNISTKLAFADLDNDRVGRSTELWVNHFEAVIADRHPEVAEAIRKLKELGALYVSLSGSGSAVYGIFEGDVKDLPETLSKLFPEMDTYCAPFPENP